MEQNITNGAPAFILASLVTSYPDEGFSENVKLLLSDVDAQSRLSQDSDQWQAVRSRLEEFVNNPVLIDNLRSEYIDIFDRGRAANPLYETEYGRDRAMVKGNELVDIAAFYKAFGLDHGAEGALREMLDHVAVELEFYAWLLLKQDVLQKNEDHEGSEIVFDARQKFLKDHLGRFVGAIVERPGVQGSEFYSKAFAMVKDLVRQECQRLKVTSTESSWLSSQGDVRGDEISCGGSVGCLQ